METYLFKFSACLAVFWLVYVLFLERQNMHRFKRFYLLSAVVLALIIPALTITHYIEPIVTDFEMSQMYLPMESSFVEMPQEESPFMDLDTILWMFYGVGVLLLSIRFAINLFKMYQRISNNETITKRSFIYVLLDECRIPHSFFKYIFFNKSTYKTDSIPREVQLHEETHAKQLHSLDIIVIELLQIVFWFHPLIYILKHHIKLNHEFLADQAVLNQGSDTKTYQNILLQFSSSTQDYQLSSAINYSSIKKRFTVMKTNTSKTRIWLSSLLLLPIIAILFYSFAEREYVEKENSDIVSAIQEELKEADKLKMQYVGENAVVAYLKKYETYENLRTTEPHYIHKTEEEKQKMDALFSDLGGMYFRMSKENKAKIKRPISPIKPYVHITLNGNTYYKKRSELTAEEIATFPPPPPVKNSQSNITIQEKPVMWILINRKDQLLVDDELGTLETINKKLKQLAKDGKSGQLVSIKYDEGTSKEIVSQVEELVNANNFKVVSFNITPIVSILINRKDQLLVDDELGTFESIDNKLKKLASEGEQGRQVLIKHDNETSKKIISKVEDLVRSNKFKVASFDISKIPPPPPPPPAPKKAKGDPIEINGATYYFTQKNGKTTYYDSYGKVVDINKIPPPPPIPNDATPEQKAKMKKATDAYMKANPDKVGKATMENGEKIDVIEVPSDLQGSLEINGETFYYTTSNGKTTYFNRHGKEVKMDNLPPPPPAPESTLDFVIRMAKANAKFFNEGKAISSDEAIALIKKNNKLNINANEKGTDGNPLVYISKKPILIGVNGKVGEPISKKQKEILPLINGKKIKTGELSMKLDDIKNLRLTLPSNEIISFKFKIPGIKTQHITGNAITDETIKNLSTVKTGDYLTLFDIKYNGDSKIAPLVIEIID